MPIYEYECVDQKHRFEVIQKFDDPPVTHCTVCGAAVQKVLSPPAIQFKGTGWYITDYARKGKSDSSPKSDTSEAAKKSDDAKPSTDSASKPAESKASDS